MAFAEIDRSVRRPLHTLPPIRRRLSGKGGCLGNLLSVRLVAFECWITEIRSRRDRRSQEFGAYSMRLYDRVGSGRSASSTERRRAITRGRTARP